MENRLVIPQVIPFGNSACVETCKQGIIVCSPAGAEILIPKAWVLGNIAECASIPKSHLVDVSRQPDRIGRSTTNFIKALVKSNSLRF